MGLGDGLVGWGGTGGNLGLGFKHLNMCITLGEGSALVGPCCQHQLPNCAHYWASTATGLQVEGDRDRDWPDVVAFSTVP